MLWLIEQQVWVTSHNIVLGGRGEGEGEMGSVQTFWETLYPPCLLEKRGFLRAKLRFFLGWCTRAVNKRISTEDGKILQDFEINNISVCAKNPNVCSIGLATYKLCGLGRLECKRDPLRVKTHAFFRTTRSKPRDAIPEGDNPWDFQALSVEKPLFSRCKCKGVNIPNVLTVSSDIENPLISSCNSLYANVYLLTLVFSKIKCYSYVAHFCDPKSRMPYLADKWLLSNINVGLSP